MQTNFGKIDLLVVYKKVASKPQNFLIAPSKFHYPFQQCLWFVVNCWQSILRPTSVYLLQLFKSWHVCALLNVLKAASLCLAQWFQGLYEVALYFFYRFLSCKKYSFIYSDLLFPHSFLLPSKIFNKQYPIFFMQENYCHSK